MPCQVATVAEISSPPPVAENAQIHFQYLDGLRGIAALYVVLHHAWLQTWPVLLYPDAWTQTPVWWALAGWLLYGHFAVTFFITLSGFCLMIPVLRRGSLRGGARGFFLGRVRRILPPYYAALLLSTVVAGWLLRPVTHTLYDASLPITSRGLVIHLLLLHNLWKPVRAQINGPLWSIAVECQIYLLFPALVGIWKRRGIFWVVCLTAASSGLLYSVERPLHDTSLTPHYLFLFGLGMCGAVYAFPRDQPAIRSHVRPSLLPFKIAGCTALLGLILSVQHFRLAYLRANDLLVGIVSLCLLVVITRERTSMVRRLASAPALVWVGSFSYSLYLIHFPLQQWFWQALVQPLHWGKIPSFFLVAVLGTALLLPVSFGFYQVAEKPFLRSKQWP